MKQSLTLPFSLTKNMDAKYWQHVTVLLLVIFIACSLMASFKSQSSFSLVLNAWKLVLGKIQIIVLILATIFMIWRNPAIVNFSKSSISVEPVTIWLVHWRRVRRYNPDDFSAIQFKKRIKSSAGHTIAYEICVFLKSFSGKDDILFDNPPEIDARELAAGLHSVYHWEIVGDA